MMNSCSPCLSSAKHAHMHTTVKSLHFHWSFLYCSKYLKKCALSNRLQGVYVAFSNFNQSNQNSHTEIKFWYVLYIYYLSFNLFRAVISCSDSDYNYFFSKLWNAWIIKYSKIIFKKRAESKLSVLNWWIFIIESQTLAIIKQIIIFCNQCIWKLHFIHPSFFILLVLLYLCIGNLLLQLNAWNRCQAFS